jgi:hypothetical protein
MKLKLIIVATALISGVGYAATTHYSNEVQTVTPNSPSPTVQAEPSATSDTTTDSSPVEMPSDPPPSSAPSDAPPAADPAPVAEPTPEPVADPAPESQPSDLSDSNNVNIMVQDCGSKDGKGIRCR